MCNSDNISRIIYNLEKIAAQEFITAEAITNQN